MGNHVKIKSSSGAGEFDCYLALPAGNAKAPAVVMASAVHGVNADIRGIADEFAAKGFIAAAPDLFWRTLPGPLPRDDKRAGERSQPRMPVIKAGETDMADTLAMVRKLPQHNAPPEVQAAYLELAKKQSQLAVHIFPGIQHGYMMRENVAAWSPPTYEFSMARSIDILNSLR
jgi:dienelactone hydrolase